jgi:hypothetical protein
MYISRHITTAIEELSTTPTIDKASRLPPKRKTCSLAVTLQIY